MKVIDNKLDYTYDNWAIQSKNKIETKSELIERSFTESKTYITNHLKNKNELFYFSVLTDSENCILNNVLFLTKIPINIIGKINSNTYIKITESIEEEGGYLICISNSTNGLEDCFYDWVKNIEDLKEYIIRKSWNIVWFYDRAI